MTKQTTDIDVITLSLHVRGELHELRFKPTLTDYNKYTNDISMSDKIAPATRYLKRVVVAEDKEKLDALIQLPGVAISLTGELNEEYTGDIEVEVKK